MNENNVQIFIAFLNESIENNSFIKLALMNKRVKTNNLNTVTAKLVNLKDGVKLSFVYRYPTKDVTKNYSIFESSIIIQQMLETYFFQADLLTLTNDFYLTINKNNIASIKRKAPSNIEKPNLTHDEIKNRIIIAENNIYLKELGVTTADWQVKTSMQDKFKQINKYVEIIDGILRNLNLEQSIKVVDMGAGKGYLTFALYDYLLNY